MEHRFLVHGQLEEVGVTADRIILEPFGKIRLQPLR